MTHPLRRLPRDLPRSARTAYIAALALTDDAATSRWRIVVGGVRRLQGSLGHDAPSSTQRAVQQLIAYRIMRRIGKLNNPHAVLMIDAVYDTIVVDETPANSQQFCEGCGQASERTWCPSCVNTLRREDCAWKAEVLEIAAHQLSTMGRVDPASIAAKLNRPLWLDEGLGGERRGGKTGVVPVLLRHHLLDDSWRKALAEVAGRIDVRGSKQQRKRLG